MKQTEILKNIYNKIDKENVDHLIFYLNQLGGKSLKYNCKRNNILKVKWFDKEAQLIARCHIQSAIDYLIHLGSDFTEKQIKIVIADLKNFVQLLDKNEKVDFIIMSTNTLPSAIHFSFAKNLFYKHQIREQNQNNYSIDLLTLYSLRLSLENRIRGLLGIDYATSKGKNTGLSSLIKIVKTLESVEYSKEINWDEIEWVNNWLNHHMHRHIRPFPWIIHQAIEILKPLLDPQEPILKNGREIYSFYSSTYLENEMEFEKEINSKLRTKYPNVEINWKSQREICKLKK
ncbi:hypothetical protein [Gelidibacter maritimus]|uniref:Uncharacterized protein n=1 Tax=Gelidibacter maritimus TaxID=2761487 RepID=A0A7W2M647_9FLAO|nr:hypothetical protein [Gelidibacter maritimus]MBA6153186.1 hypothetical protein [Gelidibacter maritimus]